MPEANVSWLNELTRYLEGRGVARQRVLAAAGISAAELDNPGSRITEAREVALWKAAERAVGDPALGLKFGTAVMGVSAFGVIGYLGRASRTWVDALGFLERYSQLVTMTRAKVYRVPGTVTLSFELTPALQALRHPGEALLGAALGAWRSATGLLDAPREVRLPYAARATADYRRLLGCPVVFGAATHAIDWRTEQVEVRLLAADGATRRYFEKAAVRALRRGTPRTLADAVRDEVRMALEHQAPSLATVARRLAQSSRTLQRRLRASSVSFGAILDEERRQLALELVEAGQLSLREISYRLGFSDPSAFRRAFHRWTGASPRDERRRRRGG